MSNENLSSSELSPVRYSALESRNRRSCHTRNNNSTHDATNLVSIPETKCIEIYINGDEYFAGCRCVVNSRYYRNLDMLLNYLTERLQPSFGAIRQIYTPVNGHPVRNLDDIVSKQKYVVAGNERFKKLHFGYCESETKKNTRYRLKPKNKFKATKPKPSGQNTLAINLYQNGNFKMKSRKLYLSPKNLENWDCVYRKIHETFKSGPVKRICSLTGIPVQDINQLINNHSYVIVGKHEVFKGGNYLNSSHKETSAKVKSVRYQRSQKSVITSRSSVVLSRSSTRSLALSRTSSSHTRKETPLLLENEVKNFVNPDHFNQSKCLDEAEYFDSLRNLLNSESARKDFVTKINVDLDADLGGIFRSKMKNIHTVGAAEIDDTPDTIVELPVDLLEAEEIEEEVTPDMERSLQHLSLDVSEEIVAYLPTMPAKVSEENQLSSNKYNLSRSQNMDSHNIFA